MLDDVARCPICCWPLAKSREEGCVLGDCSYRPEQHSPDWYRIQRNRQALRQLDAEDWSARAEAYEEAANHLERAWTVDVHKRQQGNIVAVKIRALAKRCRDIAASSRGQEE